MYGISKSTEVAVGALSFLLRPLGKIVLGISQLDFYYLQAEVLVCQRSQNSRHLKKHLHHPEIHRLCFTLCYYIKGQLPKSRKTLNELVK